MHMCVVYVCMVCVCVCVCVCACVCVHTHVHMRRPKADTGSSSMLLHLISCFKKIYSYFLYIHHVCSARRRQKRASCSLGLELQTFVSTGNRTSEEQPVLLTTELSLQSP